jgi:CRP-like cAMP-binding protein
MARKLETRWTLLDKACRAVDPSCKIPVNALSKAKTDARLMSLTAEEFDAEMSETVAFLARMREARRRLDEAFAAETREMDRRARAVEVCHAA